MLPVDEGAATRCQEASFGGERDKTEALDICTLISKNAEMGYFVWRSSKQWLFRSIWPISFQVRRRNGCSEYLASNEHPTDISLRRLTDVRKAIKREHQFFSSSHTNDSDTAGLQKGMFSWLSFVLRACRPDRKSVV